MSDADPARCPGPGVAELLAAETRLVPSSIAEDSWRDLGTAPIAADRYTSAAFFADEKEHMWRKVWQMAARDDELPDPGDLVVYENVGRSYVLIRQEDGSVRAFHNVCLHRGRKLRTDSGSATELECPFHGFTWALDGQLKRVPCAWDFAHLADRDMALPELRVAHFAGFIFVTENAAAPPLDDYLAPLPAIFERWRLEECYTGVWVGKVIHANWKVCAEAFMEAWHSVTTHPQILPFTGDANTRYSLWGDHANLALTPFGVLSPHLEGKGYTEESILEAMGLGSGRNAGAVGLTLAEGQTARALLAQANRAKYLDDAGYDSSDVTDSELLDAYTYNVFPNLSPWGGFAPNIVYRWRPWPDQNATLMEVRLLMRPNKGEPRPRAVEMTFLGEDEPWSSYTGWGLLGGIFDQDMANLPYVQDGLHASPNNRVELGNYQESRIRQFHQTLDKYLAGKITGA
jgi:phenylpropionate dioxygenase-like ring-hydroxylating dioxygenase large terminal subunit